MVFRLTVENIRTTEFPSEQAVKRLLTEEGFLADRKNKNRWTHIAETDLSFEFPAKPSDLINKDELVRVFDELKTRRAGKETSADAPEKQFSAGAGTKKITSSKAASERIMAHKREMRGWLLKNLTGRARWETEGKFIIAGVLDRNIASETGITQRDISLLIGLDNRSAITMSNHKLAEIKAGIMEYITNHAGEEKAKEFEPLFDAMMSTRNAERKSRSPT